MMKCEVCKCDTHVVHVNDKHQKVCPGCYRKESDVKNCKT